MAARKKVRAKTRKPKNTMTAGSTGFIALTRYSERDAWSVYGSDIHKTAKAALSCGCADSNGAENSAVLEITIVAQHNQTVAFEPAAKIGLKFND